MEFVSWKDEENKDSGNFIKESECSYMNGKVYGRILINRVKWF